MEIEVGVIGLEQNTSGLMEVDYILNICYHSEFPAF